MNSIKEVKKDLFKKIRQLATTISNPWLVLDDFNELLGLGEKMGGALMDINYCLQFRQWIEKCNLIDLGYIGPQFPVETYIG